MDKGGFVSVLTMRGHSTVNIGGHITLLFSIHKNQLLPRNQGSRGAGFCLADGVEASVTAIPGEEDRIEVSTMDQTILEGGDEFYREYLKELRALDRRFRGAYSITIDISLPVSQGFGMSAAGLYSLGLALCELHEISKTDGVLRLAHRLERQRSGGLGDVLAIFGGGVELRYRAGAPPSPGAVVGFPADDRVLLVWKPEEERHTSAYIDDPQWMNDITTAGEESVNRLAEGEWNESRWVNLVEEAKIFAEKSGLADEPHRKDLLDLVEGAIIEFDAEKYLTVLLCMLGTSAVVVPRFLGSGHKLGPIMDLLRSEGLGVRETRIG